MTFFYKPLLIFLQRQFQRILCIQPQAAAQTQDRKQAVAHLLRNLLMVGKWLRLIAGCLQYFLSQFTNFRNEIDKPPLRGKRKAMFPRKICCLLLRIPHLISTLYIIVD